MPRTPMSRISAKVIFCGRAGSGMPNDSVDRRGREAARNCDRTRRQQLMSSIVTVTVSTGVGQLIAKSMLAVNLLASCSAIAARPARASDSAQLTVVNRQR
jgi:hypothetical protein